MINTPQLEKGFLQIASGKEENDVLTALIKARLNATEYQIVLLILRKTWGWKKKEDWISLTQFSNYTSKTVQQVITSIKSLLKKNIVVRKTLVGKMSLYGFNKNFNEWKTLLKKTLPLKKTLITTKENFNPLLKKTLDTKDIYTKDTITKDNMLVEKITLWAYKRARVNPSCNIDSFRKSVFNAIKRIGRVKVGQFFEREDNAIQFLVNIRSPDI